MKKFSIVLSLVAMVLVSVSCFAASNIIDCDVPGGCLDFENDVNLGPGDPGSSAGGGSVGGVASGTSGGTNRWFNWWWFNRWFNR